MTSPQVTVRGWTTVGELPAENGIFHLDGMLVKLENGQVLVAGGGNAFGGAIDASALFDPVTDTWTRTASMAETRRLHTMTKLPNGKVLAVGGTFGPFRFPTPCTATAELFDPDTKTWSPTTSMAEPRLAHTATLRWRAPRPTKTQPPRFSQRSCTRPPKSTVPSASRRS